jgi:hypothetical protein
VRRPDCGRVGGFFKREAGLLSAEGHPFLASDERWLVQCSQCKKGSRGFLGSEACFGGLLAAELYGEGSKCVSRLGKACLWICRRTNDVTQSVVAFPAALESSVASWMSECGDHMAGCSDSARILREIGSRRVAGVAGQEPWGDQTREL